MTPNQVRSPAVAGLFYPDDPDILRRTVHHFLDKAPAGEPPPVAMVVPHAGYVYSGFTAACAYRTLEPAPAHQPRRVFVLSPSHRVFLEGISVGNYRAFATPLGEVALDLEAVERLAQQPDVSRDQAPHRQEHALEVHLPFLQETVRHFKLVPVVFGEISGGHLADLIASCWQPGDLLVASSDLSHFYPYNKARRLDARCHEAVLSGQPSAMSQCEACGNTGIVALMETARRNRWVPKLVDYRNSGDTAGDKSRVVGYASYLYHEKTPTRRHDPVTISGQTQARAEKPNLPALVRSHLSRILAGQPGLKATDLSALDPDLEKTGATFVTLTEKGQLRGCIGTLKAYRSLATDLLENAANAALRDPRFSPLAAAALPGVAVEVSLLSTPQPFPYRNAEALLQQLKPGVHGVILSQSGHRATFLPQVWEQLPDPRIFLQRLCQKAGLDADCWQAHPDIQVYTVEKQREEKRTS